MEHKIIIVGIGPGSVEYMIPAALKTIEEAKVLVGGSRAMEQYGKAKGQKQCVVRANMPAVMDFIRRAAQDCHVEITTLIVPGENDDEEQIRELSSWIAGLETEDGTCGRNIPLHITRFFPRFHMTDRPATDIAQVYHLADIARENLSRVLTGNC